MLHEGAILVACLHAASLAWLQLASGPMHVVMCGPGGRRGQVIRFVVIAVELHAMLAWVAHVQ